MGAKRFLERRSVLTALALYFICQVSFLINIQFPSGHNFDEFHYVPAAKQLLTLENNRNWEHPPLAKYFMAMGIAIGGDHPFGWRLMSTVFGALTLVGMYLVALTLFQSQRWALMTAALTFVNQLLYVQSRIAMLDTFMFAFVIWSIWTFVQAWRWSQNGNSRRASSYLLATGVLLGLAIACKWFAVVTWAAFVFLVLWIKLFQVWGARFSDKPRSGHAHFTYEEWFSPELWNGQTRKQWIIALGVAPLAAYFVTFLPLSFVQNGTIYPTDILSAQARMWDGQRRVGAHGPQGGAVDHPYHSTWTEWPLISRPIWYAFDREGSQNEYVRGVLLLGNPLIMWTGLAAILACAWWGVRNRSKTAFIIAVFYSFFFLTWTVIPRNISFYYYYYPAGMILSFALVECMRRLKGRWAWMSLVFLAFAIGLFAYFFPILAALRISSEDFRHWMWFQRWI